MRVHTLAQYLVAIAAVDDDIRQAARLVHELADAAKQVQAAICDSARSSELARSSGGANTDGDEQKGLDVLADEIFLAAARRAQIAWYASEEQTAPIDLDREAAIAMAIDPLDGSSNIDTNVSIGTIFSILPSGDGGPAPFLQPGHRQIASGFFVYGPRLALVLTFGRGALSFMFCDRRREFIVVNDTLAIPRSAAEFAINASNYRHWDEAVQLYFDDCLQGTEGSRSKNFNMRWIASLVADAYRIIVRGGVFLYPRDAREGYAAGRLRLVYEANPIALLIEQAGGAATDGARRLLDIQPSSLHQRSPLIFGSADEVDLIGRYHTEPSAIGARHPLFSDRGLFRA